MPDTVTPGWLNWPLGFPRTDPITRGSATTVTYNDLQAWKFIIQCMFALRERYAAVYGTTAFPPGNIPYDSGTITSAVLNADGSITIGCGEVNWASPANCTSLRWVSYSCLQCGNTFPANYDLVTTADETNPWTTVRGMITAQSWTATNEDGTGTGSLTINGLKIRNAVTANYIPSVASLVGQKWQIMKAGALVPSDRLFDKPDGLSLIIGFGATGGISTTWTPAGTTPTDPPTQYSFLKDNAAAKPIDIYSATGNWRTDAWKNKELLVFADGLLYRMTILGNTRDTVYFAKQTWTAGGNYKIMMPGTVGMPGKTIMPMFQWYTGAANALATHSALDTVQFWNSAALTVQWDEGTPCGNPPVPCAGVHHNALDIDAQIAYDDECETGRAGDYVEPDLYKSFRQVQNTILNLCGSFVDPTVNYNGAGSIPHFTPATFFSRLNINSWTSGYSWTDSTHLAIGGAPAGVIWPRSVYATLIYSDGTQTATSGILDANGVLSGGPFPHNVSDPSQDPTSVVLSLGFTRFRPLRVRFLQPATQWIPDCDQTDGCIDPAATTMDDGADPPVPSCFGVGSWIKRPKSTQYLLRGQTGIPFDGGGPFVDGDLARLFGDNGPDTSIIPQIQSGDPDAQEAPYWDGFYRGNETNQHSADRAKSRIGLVTAATPKSLTDSSKNWWSDYRNGSYIQTAKAALTDIIPYTPKTTTSPVVKGSATAAITPPRFPIDSTWVVTSDLDNSGTGAAILSGAFSFVNGSGTVTVPGEFTTAMAGMTITFTFHGVMHVENLVATGGSATTFIDTAHNTTTFPNKCWWAGGRFSTIGTPYQEFILEITRGTGATQKLWRVPITSSVDNGTGGVTLNFAAIDGLTVIAGDIGQIREPAYQLNRWHGLKLKLIDPARHVYYATITYSDDMTLFYDSITPAPGDTGKLTAADVGWSYQIIQYRYGIVMRYHAATQEWLPATGDDVARNGVAESPRKFLVDSTLNLEDTVKDYGLWMADDWGLYELFTEIYHAINLLQWTTTGLFWTSRADPNTPELNSQGISIDSYCSYDPGIGSIAGGLSWGPQVTGPSGYLSFDTAYSGFWGTESTSTDEDCHYLQEQDNTAPGTTAVYGIGQEFQGGTDYGQPGNSVGATVIYAYGYVNCSGAPPGINFSIEGYFYSGVTAANPDEQNIKTDNSYTHVADVYGPNYSVIKFDPAGSPAIFRKWASYATWAGSARNRIVGPRLGDAGSPQKPAITLGAVGPAPDSAATNDGTNGWTAINQLAILKWNFAYNGPYT
jgi:hypothetical protein